MAIASPLDSLRPPRADAPTGPPAVARHWARGRTLALDEATELVRRVYGIPEEDDALAHGRLTALVQAGWLEGRDWTNALGWRSYARPEADPALPGMAQEPARQMLYVYPNPKAVFVEVLRADGSTARVPTGEAVQDEPRWVYTDDGSPVPEHLQPPEPRLG